MSPALRRAFGLSLGAAVSLGLARFSYALMLPPMRADLGWTYFTAGAMNTVNAGGYLIGALLTARLLRRHSARRLLLAGGTVAGVALIGHGWVVGHTSLYALRFVTGLASAATFVTGGLLAAREAASPSAGAPVAASGRGAPLHAGLALGIYYGGTGVGIVVSALLVPLLVPGDGHAWQAGWIGLGIAALVATAVMAASTRDVRAAASASVERSAFAARRFGPALVAYFLFGLGYIGYMTFVVTLLREQRLAGGVITAFYAVLGIGVFASSWLWAGLLQRRRDGRAMGLLDALLAVATLLPVLSVHPLAVFASGLLFGAVFLSVVASTTALVRHNAAPGAWPAGIALFTTVFAAGQIVGPALIGRVADGAGGLRGGFALSAAALAIAAVVAWQQPAASQDAPG